MMRALIVALLCAGCGAAEVNPEAATGGAGGGKADSGGTVPDACPLPLRKLYTEHLGQLTSTARNPFAPAGIAGTDLGVSFVKDGELVFLFGDSWTTDGQEWNVDSAARAPLEWSGPDLPRVTPFLRWQDFTIDASTSELSFSVHGGDAAVRLIARGEVVRSTTGRRENSPETPVVWRLEEFRGETVRLVIDDSRTGPWGFVGTSGFELR